MPKPLDVYGAKELSQLLNISYQRMRQLRQEGRWLTPITIAHDGEILEDGLACGALYDGPEAREFARTRRTRAVAGRAADDA